MSERLSVLNIGEGRDVAAGGPAMEVHDLVVPKNVRVDDILDALQAYRPQADLDLVRRAYALSAYCHKGQLRQDGSPYLSHPLAVAYILTRWRLDEISIAAGLLHDALEDAPHLVNVEQLKAVVGPEVTHIVQGLSKLARHAFTSAEQRQAEYFMRLLLAAAEDPRVLYVKLADRLHNLMTLDAVEPEKRIRVALETQTIFAPMALRLGVGQAYDLLSDLSLRYLDPENYQHIVEVLEKRRASAQALLDEVQRQLAQELESRGLTTATIQTRVKRPSSIYRKMRRKGIPPEQVHDILGVRVIVDTVEQCYEVLGIVHQKWPYIRDEFDDYIARPKPNGYQSIHTAILLRHSDGLVPVEVQIRTYEMHEIAERGLAAHVIYKGAVPASDPRYLAWIRELKELEAQGATPEELIRSLQNLLDFDKVYVYTPKGEILELPKGATPVDFAFHVHTDLGMHCYAARVNGRQVALHYRLRTGDVVEIIPNPQQEPKESWLSFVVTHRARQKLRAYFRRKQQAQREAFRQAGREILERLLASHEWKVEDFYARLRRSPEFPRLLGGLRADTLDDFLVWVGQRKIGEDRLRHVIERLREEPSQEGLLKRLLQPFRGRRPTTHAELILQSSEEPLTLEFRRAACCAPLPGEPVFLYFSAHPGRLPALHRADCPRRRELRADRIQTEVEWRPGEKEAFPVPIHLEVEDRPGVLASVLDVFQKWNVNLSHVEARTHSGRGEIVLVAQVTDAGLLTRILRQLQNLSRVLAVQRVGFDRVPEAYDVSPAPS